MVSLTLAVPKELKEKMEQFKEINWSEISREAIAKKLERLLLLKKLDKLLEKSELTEKDAIELGNKVKEAMWKRYKKEGW